MITYITVDSTITGVGKYAYYMYNLMKPQSRVIQVIFNKKYMDERYENPVMGTGSPLLNYFLSGIVYHGIIKDVNSIEGIVHITSQTMKPVFNSKHMVVTVHDIMASQNNIKTDSILEAIKKRYMNQYLKAYMQYENILTVSNTVKSEILETFNIDERKVTVIPPYIPDYFYHLENKEKLREKLGLPGGKILILSVSSAQPRKNLGMVKRVIESLGNKYSLVRVGPAVGDSITFNNVSEATINEIYNACDLLYFPALMEGFGYPVVEAFNGSYFERLIIISEEARRWYFKSSSGFSKSFTLWALDNLFRYFPVLSLYEINMNVISSNLFTVLVIILFHLNDGTP